jgi:hypothetical protein
LLIDIQRMMNDALAAGQQSTLTDGTPHRFYFDYIDADVPNALACSYAEYSFIGVTIPLTTLLWDICNRLSASRELLAAAGLAHRQCERAIDLPGDFRTSWNLREWRPRATEGGPASRDSGRGSIFVLSRSIRRFHFPAAYAVARRAEARTLRPPSAGSSDALSDATRRHLGHAASSVAG